VYPKAAGRAWRCKKGNLHRSVTISPDLQYQEMTV